MRSFRIPIFILLLTLLLCLFAGSSVARYTNAWTRQLQSADDLVCREQWSNAEVALSDLYGRWTEQQGWLHMIIVHQELTKRRRCSSGASPWPSSRMTPGCART